MNKRSIDLLFYYRHVTLGDNKNSGYPWWGWNKKVLVVLSVVDQKPF